DRVVVMNSGIIEQAGPPQALYHRPFSQFVAGFIGSPSMNFLSATLLSGEKGLVVKLTDGRELAVPEARASDYSSHAGKSVVFGIRPEWFHKIDLRFDVGITRTGLALG
ncbi:sugar ABC transporter ATP-binding protein, partial [Rhizobium ruizarguesonis]